MDDFCSNYAGFIGSGTLDNPEMLARLPSWFSRKDASFYAIGKTFNIADGETLPVDSFTGMVECEPDASEAFDHELHCLLEKYRSPADLSETLLSVVDFWERYPAYLQPAIGDRRFDAYVGHNLPF